MSTSDIVDALLDRYGSRTRREMVRHLPAGSPRTYLYDLVASYPLRPSKMLRSTLCLATCRAFGGEIEDAIGCAASIELVHNAFMIHDDIEDASEVRRGRPTLHREHGVPIALNVGDAMSFVALRPLLANAAVFGLERSWQMLDEFLHAVGCTIEGQALDLGWMRDGVLDLDEREYLEMVRLKTCWYTTILPCRLGALAAGIELEPDDFVAFGTYLGAAFQIRDDVLNVTGTVERYGKEIGGDIQEGKRTLLLTHLVRVSTADERREIERIYGEPRERRGAGDVACIIDLMRRHGSIDHASSSAHGLAGAALREFETEFGDLPVSDDTRFIRDLAEYLVGRSR